MELDAIYNMAESNNISVYNFSMDHNKAFCIDNGQIGKVIAIDYSQVKSQREEKELLAEEVAHLKYKLLYFLTDYHNPNFMSNVSKVETKAKRRAAEMLIPLPELKQALQYNTNTWELAEIFDTSETTVRTALAHYRRKNLI